MVFNSFEFLLFFAVVYAAYVALAFRSQNVLLLVASYVFYGRWDWRFLSLILLSTIIDYTVGLALDKSSEERVRKRWLSLSVGANLGILGLFKYFNFFADSLVSGLDSFGVSVDSVTLNIVLPVGISFYTFQTMSYTIDIYRRRLKPTRDLLNFAVFVAFFPQLVAGPIERAVHLLPQMEKARRITYADVREGCWLLLLGFYKKVVLADNMAVFTGRVFEKPSEVHGLEIIAGVYAFAFQIYGDFSGYSDIARGLSKLLGFDIIHNFRMPYFAVNPSDFWRRWHISLSSWLRDYLYVPLGGNRLGVSKTYRNLMLTMVLGGLWHGAAWNFVLWGLYHGTLLCTHRLLSPWLTSMTPSSKLGKQMVGLLTIGLFFQITAGGWFLFAVHSLDDIATLLRGVVQPFELTGKMTLLSIAVFAGPVLLLDYFQERSGDMLVVKAWSPPRRLATYAFLFGLILLSGSSGGAEFIYFQF